MGGSFAYSTTIRLRRWWKIRVATHVLNRS
jgi:hypothetical protein